MTLLPHRRFLHLASAAAALLPASAFAQTASCPAVAAHDVTPADAAYSEGNYRKAEDLYGQALAQNPRDIHLSAALVQTWLHEGEISQASAQVNKMLAVDPQSAIALTALAEVQVHRGQPWQALETLNQAAASDPCYARIHLIRSRALRIDSMYASERTEIQSAHEIDAEDSDIRHAWLSVLQPAREITGIDESLKTLKDLDSETRQKARESIQAMLPMLSENNQTCKILPAATSATLPLAPFYLDAKHIDGYGLEVQLPHGNARLRVDTAASGLFISRALADQNDFHPASGAPPGTVHADSVRIGPLEFRDCTVGVSDAPFAGKSDGFIGTDMFASYLITLDHPAARLVLAPLPSQVGILPGDRPTGSATPPELSGFTPVYHRQQYLMVPVLLDNKSRKLFILDSGIRFSTMTSEAAHSVSTIKVNFTNPVQTVSGSTLQIYRDSFDFQFASLSLTHQNHILELDPTAVEQNSGIEVAGMLGFDMLHSLVMHLDYRDGLVKLESPGTDSSPARAGANMTASAASSNGAGNEDCAAGDTTDRPLSSTLEAKVTGILDSGRLKPGKTINVSVVNEWIDPECTLPQGAILYGHVTAASSLKSPGISELSLVFDHGDCEGHGNKELSFRIVGVIASPDAFAGLHSALPSQVSGGGRSISAATTNLADSGIDENLNPGGPPHTIHPGVVAGIPGMKLEPLGGPGCSSKMTNSERSVRLGPGSELILTRQSAH